MIRKLIFTATLIAALMVLASCQTVSGLGRDITWTSEAMADVIEGN